jgi:hypothetical protein
MRRTGRAFLLLGAFALVAMTVLPGCENPFDPMQKSGQIQGLSYVDFSLTWDRWDADPLYDGVTVKMSYFGQYGDSLSFHDKPHNIVVEFWTQKDLDGDPTTTTDKTFDKLIFSKSIVLANAADDIRIPIEAYRDALVSPGGFDLTTDVTLFVIVRVFPPEAFPRQELKVGYPDQPVYKIPVSPVTPNQ